MRWLKELIERIAAILTPPPPAKPVRVEVVAQAAPKYDLEIPMAGSRAWRGICWHHSASSDKPTLDWNGIVKYHTSYRIDFNIVTKEEFGSRLAAHKGKVFQKPWHAVGYHAGTELVDGKPVFSWGRSLSAVGAHAGVAGVSNKFNEDFIGICCIGNYDPISPDPALWSFNLKVTRAFMKAFNIPKEQVIGHREVFDRLKIPRQKSCPGRSWNLDLFRAEL